MDLLIVVTIITLGVLTLTAICTLPNVSATYVNKVSLKIYHLLSLEVEKKEKRSALPQKSKPNDFH